MAFAITEKYFSLHKKDFLHFIPFVLMLGLNIPFYFLSGNEKLETVSAFMEKIPSYESFDFYFSLSFFAYIGIYIFLGIGKLKRFKRQVTNNVLVNWFHVILMLYSSFLVLHLAYFMIQPIGKYNFAMINQLSMLTMTFIIQSVAYKLINKSTVFNNKTPDLRNLEKRNNDERLIIDKFMIDKVYLDDTLSLQNFSESVSLPASYVSAIINQKFNCSFKKLVTQYRLDEAKSMIQKHNGRKIKLIEIAFDAGFNNKVSFYRAFKEFEGISPSEYLEKLQNQQKP
ncbi:helix-turn-helix domain-containing protein [Fulvivirgaceae bacterium BMA12]|uniref:Helix-turn-helix domain-containing protein n=1 Tax=Agaribacillus aureus TaxID=3051825 RepID=A0ABT8LF19_9BACT|nr:helix-turn-helix domain-containing protein [Fulvivirgaceae bacterium BMA12]